MALAVGDVLQAVFCCYTETQIGLNIRHYVVTAIAGSSAVEDDLATALDGVAAAAYKAWIGVPAKWRGVGVKKIWPIAGLTFADVSNDGDGTEVSELLAGQVSGCVTLRTDLAGRSRRGRIYPPFPGKAHLENDSTLSVGGLVALEAIATIMDAPATVGAGGNTATCTPIIYNPVTNSNRGTITSYRVNDKSATQRRRGAYGARNVLPF